MKKLLLTVFILLMTTSINYADDLADVNKAFENYVNASNSYASNLPDYYINNARIIRVVNKKDGGQRSILIPFDRYVKELNSNAKLAKLVKYKNNYTNVKVSKVAKDSYKVSTIRIPRDDKTGLPAYFVFTKTDKGWKIKEESMTTNVQAFLTAK